MRVPGTTGRPAGRGSGPGRYATLAASRAATISLAVLLVPAASPLAGGAPGEVGHRAGTTEPARPPATQTSSEGVVVTTHGVVQVRPYQQAANPPVTLAVHGVQRVPDGTVVYLSVGFEDPEADASPVALNETTSTSARFSAGAALASTRVVVPGEGLLLATVPAPGSGPGGSAQPFGSPVAAFPQEPGVMAVVYAVLPPLPDEADTVHVQVGRGSVVADVPVGDGLLEPTVEADGVIPLGTGWPAVDLAAVGDVDAPEESGYPLSAVVEALDASRVTTETTDDVTIDLAADVLFAFDSAELSPEARATLDDISGQITERAAPGTLSVVGHTDSNASDAYNDDLSRRRAQAVADVLGPAVEGVGLDLVVEGRGEREPVAPNDTEEGRQANRRVSVTFAVESGGTP